MQAQAPRFHALAPNIIVKIPATQAGITAIEEATAAGVSINATVSFTVAQTIAVAEAVERGLARAQKAGHDISWMGPVCTIMVGRVDDWLKVVAEKEQITIEPGHLEWAGVAVFKNAYRIYRERGYRLRLLAAAFRNHMHWSELIGGDVVISPPCSWQKRFNSSDVPVQERIHMPVESKIVKELSRKFSDFVRASDENGLAIAEFDTFGPTVRTLRQFLDACHELEKQIREVMLPNPDRS
jgi:transaldolase